METEMATYLYIDIDAFLASVEQSVNAALRGRPVMVGGRAGERGIVYCASYEARAKGVQLGTTLAEAAKLIPDGVLLKGDYVTYEEYSQRFLAILRDHSPAVERISQDEACLDITGLERHFGSPKELALRIKGRIRQELCLSSSVGVAPSRTVAKIASEIVKPNNLTIVTPDNLQEFLDPLPVRKISGIGRVYNRILTEMGIKTIGQLRQVPEDYLIALFGQNGRKFAAYARGTDGSLARDYAVVRSVNRETGLASDITDRRVLLSHYHYLLERACRRLRDLGRKAARLTVKLRYADFEDVEGYYTISPPSWDEQTIFPMVEKTFRTLCTRRTGVRFVGVNLSNLKRCVEEDSFLFDRTEKQKRLLESLDTIRRRFGFLAVTTGRALPLDSLYTRRINGYELRTPGLSQ